MAASQILICKRQRSRGPTGFRYKTVDSQIFRSVLGGHKSTYTTHTPHQPHDTHTYTHTHTHAHTHTHTTTTRNHAHTHTTRAHEYAARLPVRSTCVPLAATQNVRAGTSWCGGALCTGCVLCALPMPSLVDAHAGGALARIGVHHAASRTLRGCACVRERCSLLLLTHIPAHPFTLHAGH